MYIPLVFTFLPVLFSFRRSFVPVEIWHQSKLPAEWLIYWSSFNKHYRHLPLLQPGHHCSLNNRLLYSLFSRLSFTAQWWTCWLLLFIWRFVSGQCVLCVHHPVFWQCIHNVLLHAYNSEQLHFFHMWGWKRERKVRYSVCISQSFFVLSFVWKGPKSGRKSWVCHFSVIMIIESRVCALSLRIFRNKSRSRFCTDFFLWMR